MTPGIKRRAAHPDAKEQVCLRCMRTHVIVTISLGISNLLKCPAIEITKAPGKKLWGQMRVWSRKFRESDVHRYGVENYGGEPYEQCLYEADF